MALILDADIGPRYGGNARSYDVKLVIRMSTTNLARLSGLHYYANGARPTMWPVRE